MTSTLSKFVCVAVGAAIGSAVTYYVIDKRLRTKYAQMLDEEVQAMREYYIGKSEKNDIPTEEESPIKDEIKSYASIVHENRYADHKEFMKKVDEVEKPYIISPDEYGEYNDYEMLTLTYFADGILADDMDEIIEDVEHTVGLNFMDHYGEYEQDTVFVRNDRLQQDYEIQRDLREYEEAVRAYEDMNRE